MKLSKQYLLDELTRKSPQELAKEIVTQQIQPAGTIEIKTYNPQQTINGKELQGN